MVDAVEGRGNSPHFVPEVFDRSPKSWEKVKEEILPMTEEGLGWGESTPLLGQTNEIVAFPDISSAFQSPDSTAVLLRDAGGKVIGYTLSFPFEKMDPESAKHIPGASYIYFTVLDKDHRGQGLVGKITDPLFEELSRQGFETVVRDSMIDNGYAGTVTRHYGDSIRGAIDHEYWPEVGRQTRFVIDINKYLEKNAQKTTQQ